MAKTQYFNYTFVSILLLFSIVACLCILLLSYEKEHYTERNAYQAVCETNPSDIFGHYGVSKEDNSDLGRYIDNFKAGNLQKLNNSQCSKTNVLVYPASHKTFQDDRKATCKDLNMKDISAFSQENGNVFLLNNGWHSDDRMMAKINDGAVSMFGISDDDCYFIPSSYSNIMKVLTKIKEFDTAEQNRVLGELSAKNSVLTSELNTTTNKLNDAQTQQQIETTSLTKTNTSLHQSKNAANIAYINMQKMKDELIASNMKLQSELPNIIDHFNSLNFRYVQDENLQTFYIQRRMKDNKYFSLLYKYASDDTENNFDSADLWFGLNKKDVNHELFQSADALVQNILNPNVCYRNDKLINNTFGKGKPACYICVEVYNSTHRFKKPLASLTFKTNPNNSEDYNQLKARYSNIKSEKFPETDMESWFSYANYVDGTPDLKTASQYLSPPDSSVDHFHIFTIRGHADVRRRWFISTGYGNFCGDNRGIMAIPHGYAGCDWDQSNKNKNHILITQNKNDSVWDIGAYEYNAFFNRGISNPSYNRGNVLMVWAVAEQNDPYQQVIYDVNLKPSSVIVPPS